MMLRRLRQIHQLNSLKVYKPLFNDLLTFKNNFKSIRNDSNVHCNFKSINAVVSAIEKIEVNNIHNLMC